MIVHARTPQQQEQLVTYIGRAIGIAPKALVGDMPYHAMGSIRDGALAGVALFTNYRGQSIEAHVCGSPGWVTRADLAQLFGYPFQQLGVLRIDLCIARNNRAARRFAERLGFVVKCVADDAFGEGMDGIVYSMRKKNCRWLR